MPVFGVHRGFTQLHSAVSIAADMFPKLCELQCERMGKMVLNHSCGVAAIRHTIYVELQAGGLGSNVGSSS